MELSADPVEILIVDPDPQVVEAIKSCFPPNRYRCATSTRAAGALELLKQSQFTVVLCALRLPGMDGIELLRRGLARQPHAAFLMLADPWDSELAAKAIKVGACDCLQKPFELNEVVTQVERVIEEQQSKMMQEIRDAVFHQNLQERTEQLHKVLQRSGSKHSVALDMLVAVLDTRESNANLHSMRVQKFSALLAEQCGYSSDRLQQFASSALLHDLGKIAIPDSILLKPDKLSAPEFEIVQHHTRFGYQVLSRVPHLQEAALLALLHHERMDGEGYPMGLRGQSIPLEARIFAVADTMDVITAGRPYCPPRSMAQARAEISRCSGVQFDPEVVDVFLGISDEQWQAAREEVTRRYESLMTLFANVAEPPQPFLKKHIDKK